VDVAHRLFPETDVPGMVADAKRAVAWVRSHCAELGIDPDRIVLVGASSGGHLALLAAYAHEDPALTPAELRGSDPLVCAVVSLYGQVRLDAMYEHASQDKLFHPDDPQPDWTAPPSPALVRLFGDNAARLRLAVMMYAGRCDWLLGGTPTEVPERYRQVSVLHHILQDNPPTLLMLGTHDEMAPISPLRELTGRLRQAGVPVTAVYLPHTDHMFDLAGTMWSPAARVAFHTLERFLAVLADTEWPGPAPTGRHGDASHDKRPPASNPRLWKEPT
jgi:acetyl esterase/lipase